MKTTIWMMAFAVLAAFGALTGCSSDDADVKVLRITGIPDNDTKELAEQYTAIGSYLEKELGVKVEWESVKSYGGAVTALASGKADLAWLGGVTTVQAERVTDGKVSLVATRDIDLKFQSYVIAHEGSDAIGAKSFADLKDDADDMTLVFGSTSSTSGHVMPRYLMGQEGLSADDFKETKFSGDHAATLKQIAEGAGDVGILNFKTYENADEATKKKAPVLFKTKPYVDYCWVARNELGSDMIGKIRAALLKLDVSNPDHQKALKANSAQKFVEAKPEYWQGIRDVVDELIEKKIFDWK